MACTPPASTRVTRAAAPRGRPATTPDHRHDERLPGGESGTVVPAALAGIASLGLNLELLRYLMRLG